eukprot:TRINITY_DN3052_c4_g1_i1.p1 TRINITY_DN3052_c4_g1~~TRINITY_DN3052_c4_g1_i1.p1  ORF type:complete len:306 (+),score=19.53 TRINITY_DN3052_c4_g1_i1:74-991(+)
MENSRAASESSILTTECSRCVAEDAEQGLLYYGERYGGRRGYGKRVSPGRSRLDSPDETGWKDLVKAVKDSWSESKTRQPVPLIVSPSRPRQQKAAPAIVNVNTMQTNSLPDKRVVSVYRPVTPPKHDSPNPPSAHESLSHWDQTTPVERVNQRVRVPYTTAPQPPQPSKHVVVRRSRSNPPVADSAHLQRRMQSLQRTITHLQSDKSRLEAERCSLTSENSRYRNALVAKDVRLQKLKGVKQQINTLANLNRKGAEIHSKRQQAVAGLDREVKLLFSDWQDTRVNPRSKHSLIANKKPRSAWVC